jgi:hypothetical protein
LVTNLWVELSLLNGSGNKGTSDSPWNTDMNRSPASLIETFDPSLPGCKDRRYSKPVEDRMSAVAGCPC